MKAPYLIVILFLIMVKSGFSLQPVSLSGTITDSINGKALNDINIVVKENATGTLSNFTGTYLLYLNEGTYNITFSGKGYVKKELEIELTDDQELVVQLRKETKEKKRRARKNDQQMELLSQK